MSTPSDNENVTSLETTLAEATDTTLQAPPENHIQVIPKASLLEGSPDEGVSIDEALGLKLSASPEDSAGGHIPKRGFEEEESLAHARRQATRAELETATNRLVEQRNTLRRLMTPDQQRYFLIVENRLRRAIVSEVAKIKKQSKGAQVMGLSLPFLFVMDFFEGLLEDVMKTLVSGDVFSYDDFPIFLNAAYLRAYTANMKHVLEEKQRELVEKGEATVGTQEVSVNFEAGKEEKTNVLAPSAKGKVFNTADLIKKK